jgi:ABC-type lipoprotein release transport system permease subunit
VIGVVEDVVPNTLLDLSRDVASIYRPLSYDVSQPPIILVRSRGDGSAVRTAVEQAVIAHDRGSRFSLRHLGDDLRRQLELTAVPARLTFLAGATVLLLALIGVHGVTALTLRERTHEIGVRMAMGASLGAISWILVRGVCQPILLGLVLGVGGSAIVIRLMESLMFGLGHYDPHGLLAAPLLLAAVAIGAVGTSITKAARLDPARILRSD